MSGIDRGLRLGLAATVIVAAAILGYGTLATQQGAPPIPDRVVAEGGDVLFTRDDIVGGKAIFQRTDLMDFGSVYGNGAYFGPDWGAQYLDLETAAVRDLTARERGSTYAALGAAARADVDAAVQREMRTNRYVASTGTLTFSERQAAAHRSLTERYRTLFLAGDAALGLPPETVRSTFRG